jgi:hypothetical protein
VFREVSNKERLRPHIDARDSVITELAFSFTCVMAHGNKEVPIHISRDSVNRSMIGNEQSPKLAAPD